MLLYTPFSSHRTRNVIFLTQAGTDTGGHCIAHTHIHTRTYTHSPNKQQKSEHVKGKFVMVFIKTLGVNRRLSGFRGYAVLIISLC